MMNTFWMAMVVIGAFLAGVSGAARECGAQTRPATQATQPATRSAAARELVLDLGNNLTLRLVQIPAGKFLMGSPGAEKGRNGNETQHEVTISNPFYLGATHVTVDQFAAFVKSSGYKTDAEKDGGSAGVGLSNGQLVRMKMPGCSWRTPGFIQRGDHPVVHLTWNDARAFCDWLSKKSGRTVVLPTEAQWEYAARAGTQTAYSWGDNPDDGQGWANVADLGLKKRLPNVSPAWKYFGWDDGFVFTSPVASFKPNSFGLYDMTGNAWQWCQDRYGAYKQGAATDPTGAGHGRPPRAAWRGLVRFPERLPHRVQVQPGPPLRL